jgi:predicted small lipoprotein YifL
MAGCRRQNLAAVPWSVMVGWSRGSLGEYFLARTWLSKCLRAGFVLAVLGVAVVSLAACGRNGPPELPPGPIFSSYQPPAAEPTAQPIGAPAATAPATLAPPSSPEDLRKQNEKAAQSGFDKSGNPVAPWSQNKSFFLDFLLQ